MDPEQERLRLKETYARFTDAQLESVAKKRAELTELAAEVLEHELARRGLKVEQRSEALPEIYDPAFKELVSVRKFRDLPEALLAKGSLESAGIECRLFDDNMIRMDWFWSNLIGGVRLQVDPEDVDAANTILNQPIPEDLDVPGIGIYHQPRCPRCQSLDIAYRELNRPVAYISAYFSLPIPLERLAWRCHSCHVEWEEDDTQSAAG